MKIYNRKELFKNRNLILCSFIFILSSICISVVPYFYKLAANILSINKNINSYFPYIIAIIFLYIFNIILNHYGYILLIKESREIYQKKRLFIVRKILNLNIDKIKKIESVYYFNSLFDDLFKIRFDIPLIFYNIPYYLLNIAIYTILIIKINFIFLILLPIVFISLYLKTTFLYKELKKRDYSAFESYKKSKSLLYDFINSINYLQYKPKKIKYGIKNYLKKFFKEENESTLSFHKLNELSNSLKYTIYYILLIFVFIFSGYFFINGKITFGDFFALIFIVSGLIQPVSKILQLREQFIINNCAFKRINDILAKEIDIEEGNIKYKLKEKNVKETKIILKEDIIKQLKKGDKIISFENVEFSYNNPSKIKFSYNFKIYHEQRIGIVGEIGSGKSTIIRLLSGMYKNYKGLIKLFDIDLKNIDKNYIISNVNILTQQKYIFTSTLKENLTFFMDEYDKKRYELLFKLLEIDKLLSKNNISEDTFLKNNGSILSGGEKQKICIFRELLYEKPIYIFDEAFSEMDQETEKRLIKNIINNSDFKNSTFIFITHRLSITSFLDNIFVLRNGEIIEQGKHEDLLKNDNYYKTLYNKYFEK